MNGQEYGVVAILVGAIGALWKMQQGNYKKNEEEKKEAIDKLFDKHDEETKELKEEIKIMHIDRKEERKEWLKALENNTEQLKNVADKLQIIPNLQKDMDGIKTDIQEIKNKFK